MKNFPRPSGLFVVTLIALGIAACDFGGGRGEVRYTVTVLPSLGGTRSAGNVINNRGWVAGNSNLPGDSTRHATLWKHGTVIDLGTLGGPNSSVVFSGLSNGGMVAGIAETAEMDSLGQDFSCSIFLLGDQDNECRGFVWKAGEMTPMPTLGGHNSFAADVNNRGQVVGWAETDVHDPTCIPPNQVLQYRGVLWEPKKDRIHELPPLPGDSVSTGNAINNRGQIVGISGECGVAVGSVSAQHAVLWEDGVPTEIGDLGGVDWHTPLDINEKGVVVGFSNPPGVVDGSLRPHAFLWTESTGIQDLGTLPGDTESQGLGINERGQVVGVSYNQADTTDLNTAVLWQDGVITDLNTLVVSGFSGHLLVAGYINDRGVITGVALDPDTGETVAYVATPTH